jgi:hypothetical protein
MAGAILSDGVMWLLRVYIVFYGAIAFLIALRPITDLARRAWSAIADELSAGRPADRSGRHSRRYTFVPVQNRDRF